MSQENVERIHQVVDAVARKDVSRLIELTDPAVEWHSFLAQLGEGGVYRGHAGMREYVRDLTEAWDVLSLEVDQAIAVGDVVLLTGRLSYRGKASGVETETLTGYTAKFREGKVVRMRAFRDPEQAIEAVGASE